MVLLECPMELTRERIHDPRTELTPLLASDSIVFDSTPNERAAT